jgi:hypothetical protein
VPSVAHALPSWGVWGTTTTSKDHERPRAGSFDHLVGEGKQLRWDVEAECLCGFEIDDQFKPSRLHHRKIGGLLTLENPTDIDAYLAIPIGKIGAIAHQATGRGEFPNLINCGHCMISYQGDKLIASTDEE